jgi:hypothetical protein
MKNTVRVYSSLAGKFGASIFYSVDHNFRLSEKLKKAFDENRDLKVLEKKTLRVVAWIIALIVVYQVALLDPGISDEVQKLTELSLWFGSTSIFIVFFIDTILGVVRGSDLVPSFIAFVKRLVFLALLTSAVQLFGDEAIAMYHSKPLVLFQVFVSLLIVMLAVNLADGPKKVYVEYIPSRTDPVVAGSLISEHLYSKGDFEHICVHEAGHALVYALLDSTPETLMVSVAPKEDGSLGRVLSCNNEGTLRDYDRLLFSMRCDLAGVVAEEVVLGKAFCGGTRDMKQWESNARLFLESGFGEFFYQLPTNELEVQANSRLLTRMKTELRDEVSVFLSGNKDMLRELAELLGEKKYLERDDIEPYLSQIRERLRLKHANDGNVPVKGRNL